MGTQRRLQIALLVSWVLFSGLCSFLIFAIREREDIIKNLSEQVNQGVEYPPPVTSNEDPNGERSFFTFSPDKKHIAFIEDVFHAYGEDYDRYWALKIFDVASRQEQLLFVDDSKLSNYEWRDAATIRVIHSGGAGVHIYRDIRIGDEPIFWKKYKYSAKQFWTLDEKYANDIRNDQDARVLYYEKTKKQSEN